MKILRPARPAGRTIGMTDKDRIDRRPGSPLSRQSTQDLLERRTVLLLFLRHHHAGSAACMTNGTEVFCIRRPYDHGGANGEGAGNDIDQFGRAVSDDVAAVHRLVTYHERTPTTPTMAIR